MSQNFNHYNVPPPSSHGLHGTTNQNFESLSGSLILPGPQTPIQQNYNQTWPATSHWGGQRQENYSYNMPYQTQGMKAGKYVPPHQQEFLSFNEVEESYQNEKGDTPLGVGPNMQAIKQNSSTLGINPDQDHLQARLNDLIKHQSQISAVSKTDEKEQVPTVPTNGTNPKPDAGALNDRAAELRARLLAKRGSTPGTPSHQISKSSDPMKVKVDDTKSLQKRFNSSISTDIPMGKTSESTNAHTSMGTKITTKSSVHPRSPSAGKPGAKTDIDGLFAEARAAIATGATKAGDKSQVMDAAGKDSKGTGHEPSTVVTTLEKTQPGSRLENHRRGSNTSISSSETSELGEIRSDSGKTLRTAIPPETITRQTGKENIRRDDQKLKHHTDVQSGQEKQSSKAVDGTTQPKGNVITKQSKPLSAAKPSASSSSLSHARDPPQNANLDHRRDRYDRYDRYDRPSLFQESPREHEQDRRRDLDVKERNVDLRRTSDFRPHGHDAERGRAELPIDVDAHRSQKTRYDVNENARAAAEYKKELEERRRQTPRTAFDRVESTKDYGKKEVETARPRTPNGRATGIRQHAADSRRSKEHSKVRLEGNGIDSSSGNSPDQHITEDVEDVRDWLEMTGFSDIKYRKTALTRFRKIKALDQQRAELEREAQLELEGRSFIRAQSTLPRESVEVNVSNTIVSPKVIRTSIQSMLPPPLPTRDFVDDVGIKIKDSANREGLANHRSANDDLRVSKQIREQQKTVTSLKRSYIDDDPNSRSGRPVEKLARIDTNGRANESKADLSPSVSRAQWPSDGRINRSEGVYERNRSRSPESQYRSISLSRGRTSNYDKYVPRQRSRGSPARRKGYSPDRQLDFSHSTSVEKAQRLDNPRCSKYDQPGHLPKDCTSFKIRRDNDYNDSSLYDSQTLQHDGKKGDIKNEHDHDSQYSSDHQNSALRPYTRQYQQYIPNNYRGRGRGGRGGYPYANNRGGYKPYRKNEAMQDTQLPGGSVSLNLAEGDSRYFMIKSWNSENVEIAQRDCTWATQEKNLAILTEAYNTCRNVILIFSINNSRAFQGYARMSSLPGAAPTPTWAKHLIWEATPPFHIRWVTIAETRFNRVGHLKNTLNEGQAVLVGRDGQEIEGDCGRLLCEMIDEEGRLSGGWYGNGGERDEWAGRGAEAEVEAERKLD